MKRNMVLLTGMMALSLLLITACSSSTIPEPIIVVETPTPDPIIVCERFEQGLLSKLDSFNLDDMLDFHLDRQLAKVATACKVGDATALDKHFNIFLTDLKDAEKAGMPTEFWDMLYYCYRVKCKPFLVNGKPAEFAISFCVNPCLK